MKTIFCFVTLGVILMPAPSIAQSVRYRVIPLTEIASAQTSCVPTAINAGGDVVGYCGAGETESFAVRWRTDGTVENLGKWQGGTFSRARAINAIGQIAGDGDDGDLKSKALVETGSGWVGIDGSGGSFQSAYGITDAGVVFGNFSTVGSPATETWDPVFWTYDARHDRYDRHDLPKPPGTSTGFSGALVFAVNRFGAAVGQVASDVVGNTAGFWNSDSSHALVVLPTPAGLGSTAAFAVSGDGRAVGMSYGVPLAEHAILWMNDAAHSPIDLGTLAGDVRSEAYGVNSAGHVVGASFNSVGRGFIYRDGAVTELTTLLDAPYSAWTVNEPAGINEAGAIIAIATLDGVRHPVLLVPFEKLKGAQTISVTLPAGPFRFGDAPFPVTATSTSGLPVMLQASGACGMAASALTIIAAGACQVTASQSGDADWEPAPDVIQTVQVGKADAAIAVTPYNATYDGAAHSSTGVATGVFGEDLSSLLSLDATTHINAGTYPADAWSFTGGTNYNDAVGTVSNHIAQAAQTITFGALVNRTFGDAPFVVSATGGGSGNPVTFTSAGNCTVDGSVVTLTAAGTCTITAMQAGDVNYLAATPVPQTFTVATAVSSAGPLVNPGPQSNREGDQVELRLVDTRVRGEFSASNLPDGLKIDKKGVIRGHIARGAAAASPYAVIVTYTADGVSSRIAFSWTITRVGRMHDSLAQRQLSLPRVIDRLGQDPFRLLRRVEAG